MAALRLVKTWNGGPLIAAAGQLSAVVIPKARDREERCNLP